MAFKIMNRWDGLTILENTDPDADLCNANLRNADLSGADLSGADLRNATLRNADLRDATLRNADLRDANLCNADLRNATLCDANLSGADLSGADLRDANLCNADLSGATLRDADLRDATLCNADLSGATLRDANLSGADLSGADLRDAKNLGLLAAELSILPDEGDVIGWKKADVNGFPCIVKLLIPADARRSNATGRKCRADRAQILAIYRNPRELLPVIVVARSRRDSSFIYRQGETVTVPDFDDDRWNECAPGIHFFITRAEAEAYLNRRQLPPATPETTPETNGDSR